MPADNIAARSYGCDANHFWRHRRADIRPGDDQCPECGAVAVIISPEIHADLVRVVIAPAEVIIDPARGQTRDEGRYYLEIRTIEGELLRESKSHYALDDALKFVKRFAGRSGEDAIKWFDRKPW